MSKGFTLIELLIVVAILAILGATVIGAFCSSEEEEDNVEQIEDENLS